MFIARNKNGDLLLFMSKPIRSTLLDGVWIPAADDQSYMLLNKNMPKYLGLKCIGLEWEDDPIEFVLLSKENVFEYINAEIDGISKRVRAAWERWFLEREGKLLKRISALDRKIGKILNNKTQQKYKQYMAEKENQTATKIWNCDECKWHAHCDIYMLGYGEPFCEI